MSESTNAWEPLRKQFKRRGWPYSRIENSVSSGMPDVIVMAKRVQESSIFGKVVLYQEIWVELKYTEFSQMNCKLLCCLKKEQYIWLKENSESGRLCFSLLRAGDGWWLSKDVNAWLLMKKPFSLQDIAPYSKWFNSPEQVCNYLQGFAK